MRIKSNPQVPLDFGSSHLKVTEAYYAKYQGINRILLKKPAILSAFHQDVPKSRSRGERQRMARFTSDQFLRAILVMAIEQLSLRATVIRIDDSTFLRRFVGIPYGPVMDFTTLSKVFKAMRPQTWKRINGHLGDHALEEERIEGRALRVDTTAYETNIHYPTDSSLLWDGYRVLSRWIEEIREYDRELVGSGRLQRRRVKRLVQRIARQSNYKEGNRRKLKRPYQVLLGHVGQVLTWSEGIAARCEACVREGAYDLETTRILMRLLARRAEWATLVQQVVDQARRRVLKGEQVPNQEKVFSLFESHTELLKRGKAGKPIEFGHMVLVGQVENRFISEYDVFRRRPSDASLIDEILERHRRRFGEFPEDFTADKGFYESRERLEELHEGILNVSIPKKGSRTREETSWEHDPVFRSLQRFRAGIEGTISYLKRCFKMSRCLYRSFRTYCSSVGALVFAHNLVVLTRL